MCIHSKMNHASFVGPDKQISQPMPFIPLSMSISLDLAECDGGHYAVSIQSIDISILMSSLTIQKIVRL